MILHYLVIWLVDRDITTRRETPIDITVDNRDEDTAQDRYDAVVKALVDNFNTPQERIAITNICRL